MEKLEITVRPHKTKRKELVNACQMIVEQTRKEAGCIDSRILKGEKDENGIILEQHWKQRHLLDGYFRTDHFSALLGAMKLLAIEFEVTINDGSPYLGAFIVDRARSSD
ncbi:MAG: antibiotic biosynthesis monooxygenase [Desulfobacterales bacterium]|jgi:quinol monooxygenase YgiN